MCVCMCVYEWVNKWPSYKRTGTLCVKTRSAMRGSKSTAMFCFPDPGDCCASSPIPAATFCAKDTRSTTRFFLKPCCSKWSHKRRYVFKAVTRPWRRHPGVPCRSRGVPTVPQAQGPPRAKVVHVPDEQFVHSVQAQHRFEFHVWHNGLQAGHNPHQIVRGRRCRVNCGGPRRPSETNE